MLLKQLPLGHVGAVSLGMVFAQAVATAGDGTSSIRKHLVVEMDRSVEVPRQCCSLLVAMVVCNPRIALEYAEGLYNAPLRP